MMTEVPERKEALEIKTTYIHYMLLSLLTSNLSSHSNGRLILFMHFQNKMLRRMRMCHYKGIYVVGSQIFPDL